MGLGHWSLEDKHLNLLEKNLTKFCAFPLKHIEVFPIRIYLSEVNNEKTRAMCEIFSKVTNIN